MESFLFVMIDRGPESFEISARTATIATMFGVRRTGLSIDPRQSLASPVVVKAVDPGLNIELVTGLADISQVNQKYVRAINVVDIASGALGLIFLGNVVR